MDRKAKDKRLRHYFNTTLEEFEKILAFQGNRCAICGKRPKTKSLSYDHNHLSGLCRGAVCWFCNKVLQMWGDNPSRFWSAFLYLSTPPAIKVIGERYGLPGRHNTKKQRKLYQKLKKEGRLYERYTG